MSQITLCWNTNYYTMKLSFKNIFHRIELLWQPLPSSDQVLTGTVIKGACFLARLAAEYNSPNVSDLDISMRQKFTALCFCAMKKILNMLQSTMIVTAIVKQYPTIQEKSRKHYFSNKIITVKNSSKLYPRTSTFHGMTKQSGSVE